MFFVWQLRTVLEEGKISIDIQFCFLSYQSNVYCFDSSEFSEKVQFSTLGTIPTEPDPPLLSERGVKHLTLSWTKRPSDDTFTLQMSDESNYFRNKYSGSSLSHVVSDLYRNNEYKFRVCIQREIITNSIVFVFR